jgi:hypothetical protein
MFIAFQHSCGSPDKTNSVEVRPLAPDELCCLILHRLPGPFRHPYARCCALPVLFGLASLTSVGEPRKRRGFRPHFSISFRSHVTGLTPGSARLPVPFSFTVRYGLPLYGRGSACIRVSSPGLSPKQDSPSNIRPALFHEAAPFALCYNLRSRQTPPTGYDAPFFTLSTSFPSYRT